MSTNVMFFLMFITVEITVIALFLLVANALNHMSKRIDAVSKLYSTSFEKLVEAYNGLYNADEARQEVYKKIIEVDRKMTDTLQQSIETDHKIVEIWKGVEETYSNSYEEYRHCVDKLEGLDKAYADIYAELQEIREIMSIFELKDSGELPQPGMDIPEGATCDQCVVNCPCAIEGAPACSIFEGSADAKIDIGEKVE